MNSRLIREFVQTNVRVRWRLLMEKKSRKDAKTMEEYCRQLKAELEDFRLYSLPNAVRFFLKREEMIRKIMVSPSAKNGENRWKKFEEIKQFCSEYAPV